MAPPIRKSARLAFEVELGADGEPPTEFRIFPAGVVRSEKGDYVFDADAAAAVMAHRGDWAVDVAVDLEHQMLDPGPPPEPTAKDARAWFRLEVRAGELWAVGVKWTADGATRLREKRQRYVSPAFNYDPATRRITELVNVAITSLPATWAAPPLVAASAAPNRVAMAALGARMNPETVKKALDAIAANDLELCKSLLQDMIAAAAAPVPAPPPEAPAEEAPPVEESAAPPPPSAEEEKKKEEQMSALARFAMALVNATDPAAAMTALARRATPAAAPPSREDAERRALVADLVKLGAETPHTSGLAVGKIAERLTAEPIEAIRERVEVLSRARGLLSAAVTPPAGTSAGLPGTAQLPPLAAAAAPVPPELAALGLTADEVRICTELKADPKEFAQFKARR